MRKISLQSGRIEGGGAVFAPPFRYYFCKKFAVASARSLVLFAYESGCN
jgi:hypothetical protein